MANWPDPQLAALAHGEVVHDRVPRHALGRWEWDVDLTRYIVYAATMMNTDPMDIFAGGVEWLVAVSPGGRMENRWMVLPEKPGDTLASAYVAEKLGITSGTDLRNLTLLIAKAIGREALVDDVCPSCQTDHRP